MERDFKRLRIIGAIDSGIQDFIDNFDEFYENTPAKVFTIKRDGVVIIINASDVKDASADS